MRLIDADEINMSDISPADGFSVYGSTAEDIELTPTIDAIPRETVFDFKVKLDKWMFHNYEDVCGQRMIDIDYLDGEIWELFQELGIVRYDDDGNLIDEVRGTNDNNN